MGGSDTREWHFYPAKLRGAVPSPHTLAMAASVLRQPLVACLIAAGWLLTSDLTDHPGCQDTSLRGDFERLVRASLRL